ncbi:TolC family protein [Anaerobaca lacustris]|uniref:TolC family protein n=1 Tax=Anaerobaca lacustris TaxID=3044600 RepID=A0AAW6TZZ2_9BACT|nr:TolC family protein [Sedimentisphaerales bacterium M17dextr]
MTVFRDRCWMVRSIPCLMFVVLLVGCGPKNYKQDADERVYSILDRQWEPEFGTQANYRVGDVERSPVDVQADKRISSSGVLTLPEAVAIATAHNREYQTQKELLYTSALDQRLVRHQFETSLFGGAGLFYSGDGTDEAVELSANVGFNRLLTTGTQITAALATAWTEVLLGPRETGLSSIFAASVTHPLLRGSDPAIVLEGLTQAKRDTLYQIRAFNRFRKTFVVWVVTQYFEALELQGRVRNAEAQVAALERLRDQARNLASVGRLPVIEVDRLQEEVLLMREVQIVAQQEYERFLDQFKIALGMAPTEDFRLDAEAMRSLAESGLAEPTFAEREAIDTALYHRLDVANAADAVLDAQRHVHVAADRLRADLRLGGTVALDTDGGKRGTAGAVLDLPLDRVAEQTAYRKALIALNQRQRDYDLTADTVRLEVRQAHRKLREAAQRYRTLVEARDLAQSRVEKTYALLGYGRTSSRRVLSAQQDLHAVNNALADALTDYAVATLNFYRDTGVLQVRPDGMWEKGPHAIGIARQVSVAEDTATPQ